MTTRGGALSRAFAPPPRFAGDLSGAGLLSERPWRIITRTIDPAPA